MVIDDETFTQIALHVRKASDGLLAAAKQMASLCDGSRDPVKERVELMHAVESLVCMNDEFVALERLLRAVWEANRGEKQWVS
jgi:hypothetical protein